MVDFKQLLKNKSLPTRTKPQDIYDSLDRRSETGPLRPSQAKILDEWYLARKTDKNTIIKLHTGEGKTLIGLLILLSKINSNEGPCLYVCPNIYLAEQVIEDARKFGIPYTTIQSSGLPDEFLSGKKLLICHVQKVFNGRTLFGINNKSINVGTIILDDSHACIDSIKNALTIRVNASHKIYKTALTLFSEDLKAQGQGTFMEIETEDPSALLPIPYWAWFTKLDEITSVILENKDDDEIRFVWPLIKDKLINCQAFISGNTLEISPSPLTIESFGTFTNAENRILMSATTQDDSFFIKGLGFDLESIKSPLTNDQVRWSGEKMIIIPSLLDESLDRSTIIEWLSEPHERTFGIVALTPSFKISQEYIKHKAISPDSKNIFQTIQSLKAGKFNQTVVIANRYDGIDLPDSSCRILIIDSKPYFDSLNDRYEEICRPCSDVINLRVAQKVEQGLGRSVRGEKDYSVIIILGGDLIKFLKSPLTSKYFSPQTKKQIEIGLQIAELASQEDKSEAAVQIVVDVINQSITRDDGWKEYYAEEMNKIQIVNNNDDINELLEMEYQAERYFIINNHLKACEVMQILCDRITDPSEKAWYLQQLARYKYNLSVIDSQNIQRSAYEGNQQLLKPIDGITYKRLQFINQNRINLIKQWMVNFHDYEEFIVHLDGLLQDLSFGMASDKFEAAMKELGNALGFLSERPDAEIKKGPDNIWCGNDQYLLIECKNEVKEDRDEITKAEAGQMNVHCGWFENEYSKTAKCKRILVIPTTKLSYYANFTHQVEIMTKHHLFKLKSNVRNFFKEFAPYSIHSLDDQSIQKWLNAHELDLPSLLNNYSVEPKPQK